MTNKQLDEQKQNKINKQTKIRIRIDDVIYVGKQEKNNKKKKLLSVISNKFLHLNLTLLSWQT